MNSTVVEILKVGISGFCFLLAYLSYRLLRAEQAKDRPRPRILRAIYVFMSLSVGLAIIVALFPADRTKTSAALPNTALPDTDYFVDYSLYHVDLNGFAPVPDADIAKPKSRVVVHRTDSLRKTTSANRDYTFVYYTTGLGINLEPVKGSLNPQLNPIESKVPGRKHYEYVLPLGTKAPNYTEVIMNNFEFVNGFRDDRGEWWVAPVKYPTKIVAVLIEFPANKPCKLLNLYRQHGQSQKTLITDNQAILSKDGRHAYWVGQDEKPETNIWFEWKW